MGGWLELSAEDWTDVFWIGKPGMNVFLDFFQHHEEPMEMARKSLLSSL